jgi:hypothetical protein
MPALYFREANQRKSTMQHPTSVAAYLRAGGAFGLVLALAACAPPTPESATPPVGASAPAQAASTTVPAPGSTPPGAMQPLRIRVDDPRVGTAVGVRTPGMGLATSGRPGWLVFGGYSPLPAGRYEALVQGSAQPGHAGTLHAEVAAGKGTEIITAVDVAPDALDAAALSGALVVVPFDLAAPRSDIEVRLGVTEASKVTVSGLEIRTRP